MPRASKPMRKRKAGKPTRSAAISAYMDKVAEIGCIACMIDGNAGTPAELHHPRAGAGGGQRAPDSDVLPICPAHHRGTMHPAIPSIHLSRNRFIEIYGTEAELLAKVRGAVSAIEWRNFEVD